MDEKRRSKLRNRQRREKPFYSNSFLEEDEASSPETETNGNGYSDFSERDDLESESDQDLPFSYENTSESYKMLGIPTVVSLSRLDHHITLKGL
jgi:hypothetical protein